MPPREEETDTIYEYLVSEEDLSWKHWRHMVPVWVYPKAEEKPKFAQLIIPTLDSVRFEKLLHLSYIVDKSSLLVGGAGTAKTSVIMQFMGKVGGLVSGPFIDPAGYCCKRSVSLWCCYFQLYGHFSPSDGLAYAPLLPSH